MLLLFRGVEIGSVWRGMKPFNFQSLQVYDIFIRTKMYIFFQWRKFEPTNLLLTHATDVIMSITYYHKYPLQTMQFHQILDVGDLKFLPNLISQPKI